MEKNRNVAFRRIHGRIIPIKQRPSMASGIGLVTAGAAASVLGSGLSFRSGMASTQFKQAAKAYTKRAASFSARSPLNTNVVSSLLWHQKAKRAASVSGFLKSAKNPFFIAGLTASAYLVHKGINNIYKNRTGKSIDATDQGSLAHAVATGGALGAAYAWRFFREGQPLRFAIKNTTKIVKTTLGR